MPKRVHRSAESFSYVLLSDRGKPEAEQSRFRFRPLTQAENLEVLDRMNNWVTVKNGTQELMPRSFQQARELVLEHLEAAENFPTDGPQPWPARASLEEKSRYLEMLDEMDLLELGNELRHHAEPTAPSDEVTVPNS